MPADLLLRYDVLGEVRTHRLDQGEVRLGRGLENDIVLPDPSVSRYHAVLRPAALVWEVVDLESTNGVLLNGERVARGPIRAGDRLRVGRFEIEAVGGGRTEPMSSELSQTSGSQATATILRPLADFRLHYGLEGEEGLAAETEPETEADTGSAPGRPRRTRSAQRVAAGAPAPAADKRRALDQAYANRIFGYLTRLARLLLTADTENEVLDRVLDLAFEAFDVERGFILFQNGDGELSCALSRIGEAVERNPQGPLPLSHTLLRQVADEQVAMVTLDAQADARLQGKQSVLIHGIRAAMCAPLWSGDGVLGVIQVDSQRTVGTFTEQDLDFLTALANYAAVAVERLRYAADVAAEQRLLGRLERYHSPAVIADLMERSDEEGGTAERPLARTAEATILFADLVGFTSFSEEAEPVEVTALLEVFFRIAVDAIFEVGGTLDKFIGDCVMAFFGAPLADPRHAQRAVDAAVAIQAGVAEWNAQLDGGRLPPLQVRIGINSGPVVVGEIGTQRRVDYTVLGDTVNVASRLEEQVATPGEIVIGGDTRERLDPETAVEAMGELRLKGLRRSVQAFKVRIP